MRRKKNEIQDKKLINSIIYESKVCRLALADPNSKQPYIVPLNFGYANNTLYFHSSLEGKKISLIKINPLVSFEFDQVFEILKTEKVCKWGVKYRSVIGFGRASIIDDAKDVNQKIEALKIIISQYYFENSQKSCLQSLDIKDFKYLDDLKSFNLNNLAIIKVEIDQMTGKQSGDFL